LYAPNIGAPNINKHTQADIKTQTDPNTVIMEDFSTPLSPIDRSSTQKETKKLKK
jgi:hypothetical protein